MYQNSSTMEKLREQCLLRGAASIKGIGRLFKQLDDDQNRTLDLYEFSNGILNHNIKLTNEECQQLFHEFDVNNSGTIDYNEFVTCLRPPLNNARMGLVRKAFQKLDKNMNGEITVEDLADNYTVKNNPKYLNGEADEMKLLASFLDHFEVAQHKNGIVTFDEFLNYYAGVSAGIDSDSYFDVIMRQSWKL